MPFGLTGIFTRVRDWTSDEAGGIAPSATRFDEDADDIAAGLTECITKTGKSTITADIPWSGRKITGLGDGTAATDAANLKTVQIQSGNYGTPTGAFVGTTLNESLTLSPALTSLVAGFTVRVQPSNTNIGNVTLNINSIGAVPVRYGGGELSIGFWAPGRLYQLTYLSGVFHVIGSSQQLTNLDAKDYSINGSFLLGQSMNTAGTSLTDGQYAQDQKVLLTQSGAVTASNISSAMSGQFSTAGRFVNTSGSAQRFGILEPLEFLDTKELAGQVVSCTARIAGPAGVNARLALLSWDGAADNITLDVVNSWTSTNYTPGNFFVASNVSVIATTSKAITTAAGTDTWTTISVTGTFPTTGNNLLMFLWTEGTIADTAAIETSGWEIIKGLPRPLYISKPLDRTIGECQRYYTKTYNINTVPGSGSASGNIRMYTAVANQTDHFQLRKDLPTSMRVGAPTVTFYSTTGASGNIRNLTAAADIAVTSIQATGHGSSGYPVTAAVVAAGTILGCHITANARL